MVSRLDEYIGGGGFCGVFETNAADCRFAAQMGVELDDKGQRYAKRLTLIWALFMSTLALMALATVFGPLWLWTVFNGGVSYGLIGLLMAGELIVRRRVMCRMN